MQFFSTRDQNRKVTSSEAIAQGLSNEGGLFVPESFPQVDVKALCELDYPAMAAAVIKEYLTDYSQDFLTEAAHKTYGEAFGGKAGYLAPVEGDTYALELWHGPTCAFKDYALQLMPKLLVEAKKNLGRTEKTLILVATSGDTGKAALDGYHDIPGVEIAVFYPTGGTSEIQRLQMATQEGANVAVYAVRGNFDDAQNVNGTNALYHDATDWLADHGWHYYTVTLTATSAKVYMDGELKNEWQVAGTGDNNTIEGAFIYGANYKYITLGGNQAFDWGDPDPGFMFDDFAVYNKELSPEQIKQIMEDKTLALPTPVYINTFEEGTGDAKIVGSGKIVSVEDKGFGQIFQNVAGSKGTNYLMLPQDALSHSVESQEVSINVWVNAKNAGASDDYRYSPLFTAYGNEPSAGSENIWPLFVLQSRGLAQINCNGWTDFTAAQNEKGVNTVYCSEYAADGIVCEEDWLKDHEWHLYTAVLTSTTCKIYIDGEVANSWTVSGSGDGNTISGIFTNGADLKYISLGGNQAWTWADPDPGFMFDDIAIYNKALTIDEIQAIMKKKKN